MAHQGKLKVSRSVRGKGARKREPVYSEPAPVVMYGPFNEPLPGIVLAKGGGEKWLKMASAMQSALEHMREIYVLLDHLRERHAESDFCMCSKHSGNWAPLLDEVTMVANILKIGLKAR